MLQHALLIEQEYDGEGFVIIRLFLFIQNVLNTIKVMLNLLINQSLKNKYFYLQKSHISI